MIMRYPIKEPDIFRIINQITIYLIILLQVLLICATDVPDVSHNPSGLYESNPSPYVNRHQKCQPIVGALCNINSYQTVRPFNNTFGHTSLQTAINELHKHVYLMSKEPCKSKIELFLCSLFLPVCIVSAPIDGLLLPCRDECEAARGACLKEIVDGEWPSEWSCNKFNLHHEDKLCVINNTAKRSMPSRQQQPQMLDETPTDLGDKESTMVTTELTTLPPNNSVCSSDTFDCKIRDPKKDMQAFCIDQKWVCDGKKDCVLDEVHSEALDEVGCEERCDSKSFLCDGACIPQTSFCNGRVDCSSGLDEHNCYDYLTGLVQSVLCIIALFAAIYLLVRFFKIGDDNLKIEIPEPPPPVIHIISVHQQSPLQRSPQQQSQTKPEHHTMPLAQSHYQTPELYPSVKDDFNSPTKCPIYHELTYSNRADYERVNIGGCSGASSVYAYSSYHSTHTPVPPPPTPAPSYKEDNDQFLLD